jgi:hypothetical protein
LSALVQVRGPDVHPLPVTTNKASREGRKGLRAKTPGQGTARLARLGKLGSDGVGPEVLGPAGNINVPMLGVGIEATRFGGSVTLEELLDPAG